jgi:hypothetical protein
MYSPDSLKAAKAKVKLVVFGILKLLNHSESFYKRIPHYSTCKLKLETEGQDVGDGDGLQLCSQEEEVAKTHAEWLVTVSGRFDNQTVKFHTVYGIRYPRPVSRGPRQVFVALWGPIYTTRMFTVGTRIWANHVLGQ